MRVLISLAVSGVRLRFFSRQVLQCFEMVVKRVVALGCLSSALVCARFSLRLNSALGLVSLHLVQVLVFMMIVDLLRLCRSPAQNGQVFAKMSTIYSIPARQVDTRRGI